MEPNNYSAFSPGSKNRIKKQLRESSELFCIQTLLDEMNLTGYLIGGTVRDLILNRPIKDIDLAISTNPEYFLKKLSRKIRGYTICLDKEYLIFRFITKNRRIFDISPLKGDHILQDLPKRDFTINAMAIDLKELFTQPTPLTIIDPLEGAQDMIKKLIRAIADNVFLDDPLRILRAYRLAGQLNFQIEENTEILIGRDKEFLNNSAPERIREELFGLLSPDYCSSQLRQLYQNRLFPIIFCQRLPQELLPEIPENAWTIALQILASVEEILQDPPISDPASLKSLNCKLSQIAGHQTTYKPLLKLAALLSVLIQSMELPQAIKIEKDTILPSRAKNSIKSSLSPIDFLLRALCLTTPQRKFILTCLQGYKEPLNLIQGNCCTPKYFYRFFRSFGEAGLGALILGMADQKARKAPSRTITDLTYLFSQMVSFYYDWQETKKQPMLDGNFLIKYFQLSQGPIIGHLIDFLQEAKAEGKVTHEEEAINLAQQFLKLDKR